LEDDETSLDEIQNLAAKPYVVYEGVRSFLPENVSPGNQASVLAQVIAPSEPGVYVIEWDMIQESVIWFSKKNATPALTRLTVTGPLDNSAPPIIIPPEKDVSIETPGRLKLWLTAWQMFQDRPLLGLGLQTFQSNYSLYTGEEKFVPHAHSLWIGWLVETGIVGLLAFIWMTWKLIHIAWRGRQLQQGENNLWIWWLACLGGIVSWLMHGFVDSTYADQQVHLAFWIVAGLILSTVAYVGDADLGG
jgi:hypothetical protein